MTNGMRNPSLNWRKLVLFILGVVAFIGLVHFSGAEKLPNLLKPDPGLLSLAGVFIALSLFMFAERWKAITDGLLDTQLTTSFAHFFYVVSSRAVSQFLPQTASVIVVRSTMLNQTHNIPLQKGVVSVLLDKLYDLFMVVLLFFPVLVFVLGIVTTAEAFVLALLILAFVSVFVSVRYAWWLTLVLQSIRLLRSILQSLPLVQNLRALEKLEELDRLVDWEPIGQKTVLKAFWLTVVGQFMMVTRTWFIAHAIGINISFPAVFLAVGLAQSSVLIAITPGSLGIMEAGWYLGLEANGVVSEDIAVFIVAHRVFTALIIVVLWLATYMIALFKTRMLTGNSNNINS